MGLKKWLKKKALRFAISDHVRSKRDYLPGSDSGWEALWGTLAVKDENDVWKTFSEVEKEKVYKNAAVVYACITRYVNATSEVRLMVGKKTDAGYEPVDHELQKVLDEPNPEMSQTEWLGFIIGAILCTGETYTVEGRDSAGYINELFPFPTSWIRYKETDNGQPYYELHQGRKKINVSWYNMTRIYFHSPINPTKAFGPLDAALKDYQLDDSRQDYMMEMTTNLAMPGIALNLSDDADYSEEERKAIKQLFKETFGKGRRGEPLILPNKDDKATPIAPLKDLDWPGLSTLSESRICAAFQVPPQTVGVRAGEAGKTFSNYEEANANFYRGTMVPFWQKLAQGLTRCLIYRERDIFKESKKDLVLYFDMSGVVSLQGDLTDAATRAIQLFHGGLVRRSQAQQIANVEIEQDKELADQYVMPMNLIPFTDAEMDIVKPQPHTEPEETETGDDDED